MNLILEAIKALFRNIWAKLTENGESIEVMQTEMMDVNGKLAELQKAVDALKPMVVNITGNDIKAPSMDTPLSEIILHLQKGGAVTPVLNGIFILDGVDTSVDNLSLRVDSWFESGFYASTVKATSGGLDSWSVSVNPTSLSVSSNYLRADVSLYQNFNGDYW